MAKDSSLHIKHDGRIYQMLDGYTRKPIPYKTAKHNYTKTQIDKLLKGQYLMHRPTVGSINPVYSILIRLQ